MYTMVAAPIVMCLPCKNNLMQVLCISTRWHARCSLCGTVVELMPHGEILNINLPAQRDEV